MTAPISPELRAFLADWLAWVERGAPEQSMWLPFRRNWPYRRSWGLCACADRRGVQRALWAALKRDFPSSWVFPFSEHHAFFAVERAASAMNINKARLAWVRAKLAEGGAK